MASDKSRNPYMRDYQKKRYHSRRKDAIKMLGGKCSSCGSTTRLEFDHKDPDNKNFAITRLWSVPEAEFKGEVKKCRLLCNSCHRKNTGKQRESGEVKSKPGKTSYEDSGRRKKSAGLRYLSQRLTKVADQLKTEQRTIIRDARRLALMLGKNLDVAVIRAREFDKSKRLPDVPVLTWAIFDHDSGKKELLFEVHARMGLEEQADKVTKILVRNLDKANSVLNYEDVRKDRGMTSHSISALHGVEDGQSKQQGIRL